MKPNSNRISRTSLDLVRGESGWREWVDLEHDNCYAGTFHWNALTDHWNALTDGKTKYIFHPQNGEDQLSDLTSDPHELRNLATDPAHADTLKLWRGRLVGHLGERGDFWVKDGELQRRTARSLFSPNYPKRAARPDQSTTASDRAVGK